MGFIAWGCLRAQEIALGRHVSELVRDLESRGMRDRNGNPYSYPSVRDWIGRAEAAGFLEPSGQGKRIRRPTQMFLEWQRDYARRTAGRKKVAARAAAKKRGGK